MNKDYNRSTLITPVDKELKKEYEDRESPTPRDEDEEERKKKMRRRPRKNKKRLTIVYKLLKPRT